MNNDNQKLKIVYKDPSVLIPYANNSRTHSEQQIKQLAASIKEYGFNVPCLIDSEDGIIAGHGRVMAATLVGMTEVPCIGIEHLTDAQRRAYIIADNKLALNAGWDMEMLMVEMQSLKEMEFNMDLTGFVGSELSEFFGGESNSGNDGEPEYQEIYNIIVECKDESEQEKAYEDLTSRGYKCQVQSL